MRNSSKEHYVDTVGGVPAAIVTMFRMDDAFGESYTHLRRLVFQGREQGLSVTMKELIVVILDLTAGHASGAINHMRAARRAGLTKTQLMEALMTTHLVLGVSSWDKAGRGIWEAWEEDDLRDIPGKKSNGPNPATEKGAGSQ